ncbi:MAG: deoxyribodipyrimidine photo-lyase [Candidatus Kapaibacteriales bacterium]
MIEFESDCQIERIREIKESKDGDENPTGVAYWITRNNRRIKNWNYIYAVDLAKHLEVPLIILKNIPKDLYYANKRTYGFFIEGVEEMVGEFEAANTPVNITIGDSSKNIKDCVKKFNISHLITDFDVLKPNIAYKEETIESLDCAVIEVDGHNIVPCLEASDKKEVGARTIRSKINKKLDKYLIDFPSNKVMPERNMSEFDSSYDFEELKKLYTDGPFLPDTYKPGRRSGLSILNSFLSNKFDDYAEDRNHPDKEALSNMSIYMNHGFVGRQEVALKVNEESGLEEKSESYKSYVEELIVRAEVAENYCHYCKDYDNAAGFANWARESLQKHDRDERPERYSHKELEFAETNDPAWNACQVQLIVEGKMHGYMRMYWAKKILEWTKNHEEAQEIAIDLNDKYELDGRDPNGFTGIAWAIGGVHDQGWKERDVFGKIRYMNYKGLKRKFDIGAYEAKYPRSLLKKNGITG